MALPPITPGEYHNGPDEQVKRGQTVEFYSVLTGEIIAFPAFVTDFQDSYESTWNSEEVYGRMDPIQTFKGTTRTISLAWDCVAANAAEAKANMDKCTKLFRMLYPTYEGSTMRGAPLLKLKFVNLVNDASAGAATAGVKEAGLVGSVAGFNYSPDLDQGFFEDDSGAAVYPQTLNLECTFTVMHTHDLGHKVGGGTNFPHSWPYNRKVGSPPESANSNSGANATFDDVAPVGSPQRKVADALRAFGLGFSGSGSGS